MGSYVYSPKIALVGDTGVGKTSLMKRYCQDIFQYNVSSIGVGQATKRLTDEDVPIELQIWDTAGQERFRTITQSYYRNAHGVVVVYDITDSDSFLGLTRWFTDVRRYAPDGVIMCLVGAKKDMETKREVTEEQARRLASDHPDIIDVIETSSKDALNIDKVFDALIRELRSRRERKDSTASSKAVQINWNMEKPKLCVLPCCGSL